MKYVGYLLLEIFMMIQYAFIIIHLYVAHGESTEVFHVKQFITH